jgi:hypothetical protein
METFVRYEETRHNSFWIISLTIVNDGYFNVTIGNIMIDKNYTYLRGGSDQISNLDDK